MINVLITGSSGFVGQHLYKMLKKKNFNLTGIDLINSKYCDHNISISSKKLNNLIKENTILVNLAAARTDFGISHNEYMNKNVIDTIAFLENIYPVKNKIKKFIHISSVAAFDGESIKESSNISSDDSYRYSKYHQERIIREWCNQNNIPLKVLYPSAIYDHSPRNDTNIGKLQKIVNHIRILPIIETKKSLTSLNKLCLFIKYLINKENEYSNFLCIEKPVKSVSSIIDDFAYKKVYFFKMPYLKNILLFIASISIKLQKKPQLTPNRVDKIFRDTSYDIVDTYKNVNNKLYNSFIN